MATEWMSIPAACRLLGIGAPAVRRLIEERRLTSRSIPPSYVRVLRAEVEALARSSTVPAESSR